MSRMASSLQCSPGPILLGPYPSYEPPVGFSFQGHPSVSRYHTSRHPACLPALEPDRGRPRLSLPRIEAPLAGRRSESCSRVLGAGRGGRGLGVPAACSPLSHRHRQAGQSGLTQDLASLGLWDQPAPLTRRPSPARGRLELGSMDRYAPPLWSYENKTPQGLVGLRNLGNTCFMNSILQCLSNTPELRDYCVRGCHRAELSPACHSKAALMEEFAKLIQSLWSSVSTEAISPSDFRTQIQRHAPKFVGYNQQDAQEFLRFLLDGLHNEVNRARIRTRVPMENTDHLSDSEMGDRMWHRYLEQEDSKVVDLFVGQLKSSLTCSHCGYCSTVFDPFWDLSLPVAKKSVGEVNLMDCMRLFTREDVLDGDEKPTCCRCKARRKCTKKFTIQKFPQILVLHLKRFSESCIRSSKLSTFVNFPLSDLDLREFSSDGSTNTVYNLYAVSNHSGNTLGGHYTAYCRNPVLGDWYNYNDSRVSPLSSSQVPSSDAYVLFYELTSSSLM